MRERKSESSMGRGERRGKGEGVASYRVATTWESGVLVRV
jgi:hypothetical protein